jgi:uncharacterized protein YjbJ (UPF0337 family)
MNSSTEDNIKGNAKQAKGAVKETTGRVTGNKDLEARGQGERAEGKVQDKVGDVKNVFGK